MRDFHFPGRSTVMAENGLCATSHPLAAKTAIDILQSGGNAVDAAIGAGVLLGLCEPQMTGIGGDCFVLLSPVGTDDVVALNGSGRAPAALSSADLRDEGHTTIPLRSPHAVTVPGAIDAFCQLSKDWGSKELADILAPAIHYAEIGVPVAPRTSFDWHIAAETIQGAARNIYLVDGKPATPGQFFRAPMQAEVLRRVAKDGRSAFYEGEIAEDMVKSLRNLGGIHTVDDFANTKASYSDPISGTYKGIELVEHPPNGQGATAILMNNILSNFDIVSMDPFGTRRVHIEAEATKLAYDARNRFLADSDHTTRLANMVDTDVAKQLAMLIDHRKAQANTTQLSEQVHKDTVYLTVIDKDRMTVSLIYSIFHSFGSGIASDKFGVLFQNRGAGFNLEEGHPNEAMGGKRPMHTIIPGILRESGRVTTSFGVMGGAYQPCGHSRFLSNLVDFSMDAQEAIDAPRAFAEGSILKVERGYSDKVRQELSELGHSVEIPDGPIGGAQAVQIDDKNGILIGASDPRKDGCALGY